MDGCAHRVPAAAIHYDTCDHGGLEGKKALPSVVRRRCCGSKQFGQRGRTAVRDEAAAGVRRTLSS